MIVPQPPSLTSLSTIPTHSVLHTLPAPSVWFSSNLSPRFYSARRNSRFVSFLRTLVLSCRSFCSRCPLFSMACALFDKNTGVRACLSANSASRITVAFDSDRLCFHNLTNPFFHNSFPLTSMQTPGGCGVPPSSAALSLEGPASSSGLRKYRHIASRSQRETKANAKRTQPCVPFNALYRHSMHRNTIQRKVWSHKANSGRLDVESLWGLRAVIQSVGTSAACGAAQSHERY